MDIGRSFSAPFKDPKWVQKVGLGGLWGLLVVTAPAQTAYQMDYIKSVANGDETLPEWSDFGGLWVRGFLAGLGYLIYMLPAVVLGFISFVPLVLASMSGDSDAAAAAGLGSMCLFGGIAMIWVIVVSIFALAGITNYAMTGRFGAMFAFGEIMTKIKTPGYWAAWGMNMVVYFVAGTIVSMLSATGVGSILATWVYFPAYLIGGHLIGQWAASAYATQGLAPAAPTGYPAPAAPVAPPAPVAPVAPPAPVAPVVPAAPAAPAAAPPAPVQPAAPVMAPPPPPPAPVAPPAAPVAFEAPAPVAPPAESAPVVQEPVAEEPAPVAPAVEAPAPAEPAPAVEPPAEPAQEADTQE